VRAVVDYWLDDQEFNKRYEEEFSLRHNVKDGCKIYSEMNICGLFSEVKRSERESNNLQPISLEV
jgi:hypothetical protein